MIHFICKHCRRPVRVDDRYGGKKGRCPHCKRTVTIPPGEAIDDLAAAFGTAGAKLNDTGASNIPPPPGVSSRERPISEQLILPDDIDVDLADTVVLPAEEFSEKQDPPPQASPAQTPHHSHTQRARSNLRTTRTILIVVATIVVLIMAAIGFALATYLL